MSGWLADIANLRREFAGHLTIALSQLFGFTLTSDTSAIGDADQVEKADPGQDPDGTTKGQRPATRIQPFGFQSRPPKGLRTLWLRLGSSNVLFLGIAPQQKYGPQSLNPGETALYCTATGCAILLDKDGNVIITPASGKTVQLAGNAAAVGRVGDATDMGTWAHVPASGSGVTACSLTYTPPGGSPAAITSAVPLSGKISGGSSKVNAG